MNIENEIFSVLSGSQSTGLKKHLCFGRGFDKETIIGPCRPFSKIKLAKLLNECHLKILGLADIYRGWFSLSE